MKKLLFFLILASGVVLQGITKFKYLSKMDERSIIRRECEQIERAWFYQGEKEISCDDLATSMNRLLQNSRDLIQASKQAKNPSATKKRTIQFIKNKLDEELWTPDIMSSIALILPEQMSQNTLKTELDYLKAPIVEEVDQVE